MKALTVDTLPPVAADHDPVRCLLAIELSKKSWIVAITTALSDRISRYTLDGCDWKGLLELWSGSALALLERWADQWK